MILSGEYQSQFNCSSVCTIACGTRTYLFVMGEKDHSILMRARMRGIDMYVMQYSNACP